MTETKVKIMKVYNPFNDEYEDLVCKFEISINKDKLEYANLDSIISESGIDLTVYLKEDNIAAEVESNFVEAYDG